MALRLPRFQSGRPLTDEVTADKLNQLVDAIRQCELNSGVGYDVNRGPGGTTLTVRPGVVAAAAGRTVILGMTNSGMSHTDNSVANPGTSSYGMQCKEPSGSYVTAYVHGVTNGYSSVFNTANSRTSISATTKFLTGDYTEGGYWYSLSGSDTHRRVGLTVNDVEGFDATSSSLTYATECDAITSGNYVSLSGASSAAVVCNSSAQIMQGADADGTAGEWSTGGSGTTRVCSGTTYYRNNTCTGRVITASYSFTSKGTATGNYTRDQGYLSYHAGGPSLPTGTYSYKRTFTASNVDASSPYFRCWVRIGQHYYNDSTLVSLSSVRLNGQSVAFTYFDANGASNATPFFIVYPIEFSGTLLEGANTIEFNILNQNVDAYPSVSFEFAPTTATITALSGVTVGGFADLTEAQQDLIGQGTPVKVKITGTDKIYAYNGTGSKTSSGSYTFVRDV